MKYDERKLLNASEIVLSSGHAEGNTSRSEEMVLFLLEAKKALRRGKKGE